MSETVVLRARNIVREFPSGNEILRVLKGVSLDLHAGEIVGIFGPSGAGKSTLLHILGTLDRPTQGELWILGQDPFRLGDPELSRFRSQTIGFVFQFHHLFTELTALENVMLPMMLRGLPDARARAEALLEEVGLQDRMHHRPTELSGGESQRVTVARALANEPPILLADEPTGNLDSANEERLLDLFQALNERHGTAILIVSHNRRIQSFCHRALYLKDGVLSHEPENRTP